MPRPSSRGSGIHRGAEGRRQTEVELQRQKQRAEQRKSNDRMPFRFYVPVGETRECIVVDDAPDFFRYEHNLPGPDKKYRTHCGCVREDTSCPVCEALGKESYYVMFLTVIDLTPFTTSAGETVEFSKKLLAVKTSQQKKFLRTYDKQGTLRGALFSMTRDGDKDAAIGNDIELIEFVPEEELETYVRDWVDKEKKQHTEVCHEPFDYDALFPPATEEELRALVGGSPPPGSRAADAAALRDRTPRRPRIRSGAEPVEADGGDDWEAADDKSSFGEDAPARRGRAKPAAEPRRAAPSERITRRRPAQEPADDDYDDADAGDDAPPPRASRSAARPAGRTAAPHAARRGVEKPPFDPDDSDDPEADDADDAPPPRRSRAAPAEPPASRRANMRGRR